MNRTEAARLAGFKWPSRIAYQLEQSPKIMARIRNERNKLYQTELASQAVQTLKETMDDRDAPASARGCSGTDGTGACWGHRQALAG